MMCMTGHLSVQVPLQGPGKHRVAVGDLPPMFHLLQLDQMPLLSQVFKRRPLGLHPGPRAQLVHRALPARR